MVDPSAGILRSRYLDSRHTSAREMLFITGWGLRKHYSQR